MSESELTRLLRLPLNALGRLDPEVERELGGPKEADIAVLAQALEDMHETGMTFRQLSPKERLDAKEEFIRHILETDEHEDVEWARDLVQGAASFIDKTGGWGWRWPDRQGFRQAPPPQE